MAQMVDGSSKQYLSCKVFREWSVVKLREKFISIRRVYICYTFLEQYLTASVEKVTGVA